MKRGKENVDNDDDHDVDGVAAGGLHFMDVPIFEHVEKDRVKRDILKCRIDGTPFLLSGNKRRKVAMQAFRRYVDAIGNTSNESSGNGPRILLENMIADLGSEKVPVRRPCDTFPGYTCDVVDMSTFLEKTWRRNNATATEDKDVDKGMYLHQWQYMTSRSGRKRLKDACNRVTGLGDILEHDILSHWVKSSPKGRATHNPLQYIFMGNETTGTHIHRDNGGLCIMIAPVVGEKEVITMHRADGYTGSATGLLPKNIFDVDLAENPLLMFNRLWRVVVRPGEVLVLPAGTYHAVRNRSPCFSVHRVHLDVVNMPLFLQSFSLLEECEIDHSQILWNAAHGIMDAIEDDTERDGSSRGKHPLVPSLRKLRACVKLIESGGFAKTYRCIQSFEWSSLLKDIDVTCRRDCLLKFDDDAHLKSAFDIFRATYTKKLELSVDPRVIQLTANVAMRNALLGDAWRRLSDTQKEPFVREASNARLGAIDGRKRRRTETGGHSHGSGENKRPVVGALGLVPGR
eukprot:g907.t1